MQAHNLHCLLLPAQRIITTCTIWFCVLNVCSLPALFGSGFSMHALYLHFWSLPAQCMRSICIFWSLPAQCMRSICIFWSLPAQCLRSICIFWSLPAQCMRSICIFWSLSAQCMRSICIFWSLPAQCLRLPDYCLLAYYSLSAPCLQEQAGQRQTWAKSRVDRFCMFRPRNSQLHGLQSLVIGCSSCLFYNLRLC